MRHPFPFSILAAGLLALSGCDFSTEPQSILVRFSPIHTLNADGTCNMRYRAEAAGAGAARWEGVRILRGGSVVYEVEGEDTSDFWGDNEILAGETQVSTPYTLPADAAEVFLEIDYRIASGTRTSSIPVTCRVAS